MPRVSDIIIPDNRRRNSEQIAQAMQMYNMMKEQQSAKLRAEQEERKNRLEELRYKEFERKNKNDEQRQEEVLKIQKHKQALDIRNTMLKPLRKDLEGTWGRHKNSLDTTKEIKRFFKKADEEPDMSASWDDKGLVLCEKYLESLGKSSRITQVALGERKAILDPFMTKLDEFKNSIALHKGDKKYLNPDIRKKFVQWVDEVAVDHQKGYDMQLEQYNKTKQDLSEYVPDPNIKKLYFGDLKTSYDQFHLGDEDYNYYDQLGRQKEAEVRQSVEDRIQSGIVQQNTDKYKPLYDKMAEGRVDPFSSLR